MEGMNTAGRRIAIRKNASVVCCAVMPAPVACIDLGEVKFKRRKRTRVNAVARRRAFRRACLRCAGLSDTSKVIGLDNYLRARISAIQRHGENDNAAFDNVLPVRVYPDIGQAIVDDLQKIMTPVTTPKTVPTPPANDTPRQRTRGSNRIRYSSYIKPRLLVRNQYALLPQAAEGIKHAGERA